TLLLYSDGFEVAFPDEDADEHQAKLPTLEYIEHLTHLAGESDLPRAMRRLDQKLDAQRGSLHQADDVTALAISITEAGAVRKAA
ncbi:MAG: hypothetical protein KDA28_16550, partial [Phycisphaerales bacterium]|nr:hypothetical protein [Phycisphaerales bacterium]